MNSSHPNPKSLLGPAVQSIIPRPASVQWESGTFSLTTDTPIYFEPEQEEIRFIAGSLAEKLRPATGYPLPLSPAGNAPQARGVSLTMTGGDPALGEEGYEIQVTPEAVHLVAYQPAGLFYAVQTLRQMLPPAIDCPDLQPGPWMISCGIVHDTPRFAWRGVMLDVARHFFPVGDVLRYLDLLAYYKINRLHLHLSDDQGWRIQIHSWPRLTTVGGCGQVGEGPGGFYTQEEYRQIVAYARQRYITIVPEIDLPGHTQAALASYAELNPDGNAPALYNGIQVGFSSLCIEKEITYQFLDDVLGELAALTPGPYLHIGGDEADATDPTQYVEFIARVQEIVQKYGKRVIGWEEIAQAQLLSNTLVQHWNIRPERSGLPLLAAQQGAKVILSPANKTYMDMKYQPGFPLGLEWAGMIEVQDAYAWDPLQVVPGLAESDILGLEAALWSETLQTMQDIETMTFPRLPGYAELAWSPGEGKDWEEYQLRLASHGTRLEALGIHYYRSPQIAWKKLEM